MSADLSESERKATARQAALAIAIVLLVVLWAGHFLLNLFGVSIPALETAGGIIVLLLGLSMLNSKKSGQAHSEAEERATQKQDSIAVVPVAIPIVAGPGAITTVLVNSTKLNGHIPSMIALSAICAAYGILFWLCFRSAGRISAIIGVHGTAIVTRIMGMVLAAIAIAMITTGLKELLPGLDATPTDTA